MTTPAFPSTNSMATASGVMTQGHPGMDLRDYFAVASLRVVASGFHNIGTDYLDTIHYRFAAEAAYEMADAMLAAREGGAA